jgi:hypothetical protein
MYREDSANAAASGFVPETGAFPHTFLSQETFNFIRIHLPVARLRIDEDRPCTQVADGIRRRNKTQRWNQDLIFRLDTDNL